MRILVCTEAPSGRGCPWASGVLVLVHVWTWKSGTCLMEDSPFLPTSLRYLGLLGGS